MSDNLVSSTPAAPRFHWDLFLSFRGEDMRHNITKNICDSLGEHGVRVFLNDTGMTRGDEIASSIFEAIEDSACYIIFLSPSYADSHWCLQNLARICELRRLILPVFYRVNPSDVRRQKGPFQEDLRNHLQRFGEAKVPEWRRAMEKVGGTSGFVTHSCSEEEQLSLIWQLVNRVLRHLRRTPVGIAPYTVGLDSRVEKLMKLLDVKSSRIQVLGLHGIGGVGKTTLATALYNKLIGHFEHRCFIPSVREFSKGDGIVSLQNKLILELSNKTASPVNDFDSGISAIKQILLEKKVLVVLDDVDDVHQLNALAGNRDWLSEGSRIIITTRNKEVLVEHIVNESHEVRELYEPEALQLFSYHSLRREKPTKDYMDLSNQIVSITGRLPLALEVFGSFLFHKRRIKEWKDALEQLQKIRPHDLQAVLRISFDGLQGQEKIVFLDIACLFVKMGMEREELTDILNGCGFTATIITVLIEKSLIKIGENCRLWMHDQIRDMGRQIVLQENLVYPGMRSRLWDHDEIMTVLKHEKGTGSIQGIITDFRKNYVKDLTTETIAWNNFLATPNLTSALIYLKEKFMRFLQRRAEKEGEVVLGTKSFQSMVNLRLLQIDYANLEGKFKSFPSEVKWLRWKGCPLKNLPSDYCLGQLAVLDLSKSGIEQVCGGWFSHKVAENLMVLNLYNCYNLVSLPDLSGYKNLQKLNLELCVRLRKIHNSVGNLRTLLHLNLKECSNLVEFPSDVSGLKLLQNLILSGCSELQSLPEGIGSMNSLKELLVDETSISKLPESIYRLTKLETLSLNGCKFIKQLPQCLGNLNSLEMLSLNHSALEELPDSVGSLSNLKKLGLILCRSLTKIPESTGKLKSLTDVSVDGSAIQELPASIGSLTFLKVLSAGGCQLLRKVPNSIGGLASVSELKLDGTSIRHLPDQIGSLKMIEKLYMRRCKSLEYLPEAIGGMLTLVTLNLSGANIIELPESIGMLENLITLYLNECTKLQKLPSSFGNLRSLNHLFMTSTAVTELPESFGMLCSLMVLQMRKKPVQSQGTQNKLVVLPTSFSNLYLLEELNARGWRISGKIPDDFEKLSKLEFLDFGYNNFCSLPGSLKGLSFLRKLFLPHCEELKSLPPLPSSLEEVDAADCVALESISDVSNLESLELLNLTNCTRVVDIPGLECLKSLTRLYMSGCRACSLAVKRRLSKACLRNMRNLSMPGSQIPDWFDQGIVAFSEHRNREIRGVIIGVVVSFSQQIPDVIRDYSIVPDIQATILILNATVFRTALYWRGIPATQEDQIHLCWYPRRHPLVFQLKEGYKIEVTKRNPPIIEGIQLKKSGIYLVYENDDDYEGNEESLDESQQSVSERLRKFFNSIEEDGGASSVEREEPHI